MSDKRCPRCDSGSLACTVSPYTILWSCRYCPGRIFEHREAAPRAFVDSDTARACVADSTPASPELAAREAGNAGSNPAREGSAETSAVTAGAIPVAGAEFASVPNRHGLPGERTGTAEENATLSGTARPRGEPLQEVAAGSTPVAGTDGDERDDDSDSPWTEDSGPGEFDPINPY